MVLFSYKNRPPGFSSTTTLIGPSVLGLTEVYKRYSSRLSIQPNCRQGYQGFWALGLAPCSIDARRLWAFCAFFNKQARGTQVQVWCLLASQSATKSSSHLGLQTVLLLPKSFHFFPPLGSRVAMLKSIFCALPEQVWIKAAASPSPTCPDLYYPSEVFAKKENLKKLTSVISSLLPMLCFSHRTCFLPTICRD